MYDEEGKTPTFVDDENFRPRPSRARFLVLADLLCKNLGGFDAQSNPGERVDCNATDVTSGNAYSRASRESKCG